MTIHHDYYCDIICIILFCLMTISNLSIFARDRRERFGEFCLPDSHVLKTWCGDVFGDVKPDQNPHGMKHA